MKYGIYFAYWEKEWAAEQIRYISKVKKLGFDILEISCAMLKDISDEKLKELRHEAKAEGVILTAGYGPNASENLASADPEVVKHAIAFYTDILKKLEILEMDPLYPSLRTKRIQGTVDLFEFSVNMDVRVIWQYDGDTIILLLDIGHHDILNQF